MEPKELTMFEIEKGIEIPEARAGKRTYPWQEMEIGDSFFVKGGTYDQLNSATSYAGSRRNKKFVVRVVPEGVRIWRTK